MFVEAFGFKVTHWHSFLTIQFPVFNLFVGSPVEIVLVVTSCNFSQQNVCENLKEALIGSSFSYCPQDYFVQYLAVAWINGDQPVCLDAEYTLNQFGC